MHGFARNHPVILFTLLAYAFSWSCWIPAYHYFELDRSLLVALTILGSFGPAVAGIALLRFGNPAKDEIPARPWGFLFGVALVPLAMLLMAYGPESPIQGSFTTPTADSWFALSLFVIAAILSGWIFVSIFSRNPVLRRHFAGLIPDRRALLILLPMLFFLPAIFIFSDQLALAIGWPVENPIYREQPTSLWLPDMIVKIVTVSIMTGGNEEHGWRGVLLPIMQRRWNPLMVSLIIGLIWEFWHFPLVMNGFYGDTDIATLVALRLSVALSYAVMLTALYNFSRGSVFLCVIFHGCINAQYLQFGRSEIINMVMVAVAVALIIGLRMWRRETAYDPMADQSEAR